MKTHTLSREHKKLAIISLFASLCGMFAMQLATPASDVSSGLGAVTTQDVSLREGEAGIPDGTAKVRSPGPVDKRAPRIQRYKNRAHQAACGTRGCKPNTARKLNMFDYFTR